MPADSKPAVVHGIFQRLSTVTTARALEGLINEYIDQSSKRLAIDPAKAQAAVPDAKNYQALLKKKKLPQRPGVDFVESIHPTTVHVGGFLSDFAPGFDLHNPDQQPTGLRVVGDEWVKRTDPVRKDRDKPTRAHHLLFSISEELQKRALALGLPIQDVLMASAVGAMNRWAAWAYPNSGVGYLLGVHTDKPNSHIHGLVFPRNSDDNWLNLSRMAKVEANGRKFRMDYQGYLHRSYEDELVAFATMTGPENRRDRGAVAQTRARGTIVALRDFPAALDQFEAKKHPDQTAAIIAVTRDNAEDYRSPDAIRAEQAEHKKRFVEDILPLKSDRRGLKDALLEIAGKVRAAADRLTPEIDSIRKAREAFSAAHAAYADSPFAYKLVPAAHGKLSHPNTITREWAESLPEHRHLLISDNPFMWEIGAKEVTKTRTLEAKSFAKVASNSMAAVAATGPAFEAFPTRVGYQLGRASEIKSALEGSTPSYLASAITDEPSPGILAATDKGFAEVKHAALEAGHALFSRHQPFDMATDADRDFSPIYHKGSADSDEEVEHHVPALADKAALLYNPTGIDPEQKFEPTDLEKLLDDAFANYRRGGTGGNQAGSGEAPTPAMM